MAYKSYLTYRGSEGLKGKTVVVAESFPTAGWFCPVEFDKGMTEAEYEHECSRAELLGLPKPSREEFFSKRELANEKDIEAEEELTAEQAEEKDARQEGFSRISGGLDELNSILSSTQRKLNRFKNVCGSFTNLLKIGLKKESENEVQMSGSSDENNEEPKKIPPKSPQMMKKGGGTELDKLDSLISKAEKAELSLSSQNKQMKKFLN